MTDNLVRPFRITVSDEALTDLKQRLTHTRWPEPECVDDWSQGIPLAYTQDLVRYWADEYDWRDREARLNRFSHFTTTLDPAGGDAGDGGDGDGDGEPVDIHFIHQRSPHEDAFPLIITHGWPGSVVEFAKIIEPLTDPTAHGGRAEDAFHVVCPSLPGYGFSGKPTSTGWGVERIAAGWDTLMGRLGYARYGAQGGDWGAAVTTEIGRNQGGCIAIHTNMPIGQPTSESMQNPSDDDARAFVAMKHYRKWEAGYSKQQATRPQTLGYGLVDSPVAQLAWIVEKFWSWSDCDGHPENVFTRDELLDNVMLYWLNGAGASSARLYWESFGAFGTREPVLLPTGVADFPKEILRSPRPWCEPHYNITRWTTMARGGHFAAFEQPDLLVDDIRAFFATVR